MRYSTPKMMSLQTRAGTNNDNEWLYRLFRHTSKLFIEASWGWDEFFQKEAFLANLPGSGFSILEGEGNPIGGYHLAAKNDHFWLELILIEPSLQRLGYGSLLMEEIQKKASAKAKPIKLSVLKVNPAQEFYLKTGFEIASEDQHSYKMIWRGAEPTVSD